MQRMTREERVVAAKTRRTERRLAMRDFMNQPVDVRAKVYTLAKLELEDLRCVLLKERYEIADLVAALTAMWRLGLILDGTPFTFLRAVSQFPERIQRYAWRGETSMSNDAAFGGACRVPIGTTVMKGYEYVKLAKGKSSVSRRRRERIMMIADLNFKCPECDKYITSISAWVIKKRLVEDEILPSGTLIKKRPCCKRCFYRLKQEKNKKPGPAATELPADMVCPKCKRHVPRRGKWSMKARTCRRCAREES